MDNYIKAQWGLYRPLTPLKYKVFAIALHLKSSQKHTQLKQKLIHLNYKINGVVKTCNS
jgi:hypothetical protein